MRIETSDGTVLAVQDLGCGPAVVFLPGFGLDHAVWDRQVRLLAPNHRTVCLDQRGHGQSDAPLDGYDIDRLAADTADVLGKLGVTAAAVVGWSFGGQVAFHLAARHPELVASLVLVGSNGVRASRSDRFPFGPPERPTETMLVASEQHDRLGARRATIRSAFAAEPARDLLDWLVQRSLQMPSWAAVACYRTMLRTDLLDEIPAVTQPVLQVIGSADPVHSISAARWLRDALPDAELVEIEGCGHYPMFERPDELDLALTEFVRTRAGARPRREGAL